MKHTLTRLASLTIISLSLLLLVAAPLRVSAEAAANTTPASSDRLSVIKTKGDQEIARRLKALGGLSAKITATTKLTAADRASLQTEVTTEVTNLTALRTKLAAETTIAAAAADVQSMVTEYRVYALVVPKVQLIKTADGQQLTEALLTSLAAKLQTRLTAANAHGKDITDLQTKLDDMESKMVAAESISASVEQNVLTLEPTTYNNDHGIVSGYQNQLKTAHQNNVGALADAKIIVQGLKDFK